MGKKEVIGVNEMACVAVLIPTEKLGLPNPRTVTEKTPLSDESRAKVNELIETSKQYGGVGSTIVELKYFAILIDTAKWKEHGKPFFDWCESKGYEPKVANRAVIIDKRYSAGGMYEGVVVDIPPQYIDEAVRSFILKYCDEVSVTQIMDSHILMFEGELYPEVKITLMYNKGFFGGGLGHNVAYVTENPTRDYKRILNDVEKTVKEWIENHKGVYKHDA